MIEILMVDDNPSDLEIYRFITGTFKDVKITPRERPPTDLDELKKYDAIILDNNLGRGMTGLAYASLISQSYPLKPIMLMTGEDIDRDARLIVDELVHKNSEARFQVAAANIVRDVRRVQLASMGHKGVSHGRN